VGFPGLVMALLFLLVPDYKNVVVNRPGNTRHLRASN
jgi:hypothetical protein